MLYRGILGDAYSGSIGAITASHCRGSRYFRGRVVPINPNTERQQFTRNAMSSVSEDWQELGPTYWAAWARFASQVRRSNALGDASSRTAFNEFVRWASARKFANLVFASDLPLFPAVPTGPQIEIVDVPVGTIETAGTEFKLAWDSAPAWASDSDNALLVWVAANRGAAEPPTNTFILPTHHYFRGPWWLIGMIRGNPEEPPSEATFTLANEIVIGCKLPWKARLTTRYQGMSGEIGAHAERFP